MTRALRQLDILQYSLLMTVNAPSNANFTFSTAAGSVINGSRSSTILPTSEVPAKLYNEV